MTITGYGTAFEATISWEVRQGRRQGRRAGHHPGRRERRVRRVHATRSSSPPATYEMRAFESSAEDGSPQHVDTKTSPSCHRRRDARGQLPAARVAGQQGVRSRGACRRSRCAARSGRGGTPWRRPPVERGQLLGAEAALGADDDHDLAGGRRRRRRPAAASASSCRSTPRRGPAQPVGHVARCRPARRRPGTGPAATAWRPPAPSYATGPAPSRRARRASGSRTGPRPTARSRRRPPRSSSRPRVSPRSPLGSACTTTSQRRRRAAPSTTSATSTSRRPCR